MSAETDTALRREAAWFMRTISSSPETRIRGSTFSPCLNHKYQCPRCWIRDGIRSSLRSIPGTEEYDVLKCNSERCGAEFLIPF